MHGTCSSYSSRAPHARRFTLLDAAVERLAVKHADRFADLPARWERVKAWQDREYESATAREATYVVNDVHVPIAVPMVAVRDK